MIMKTIHPWTSRALAALLLTLLAWPVAGGNGPDVRRYLIAKGQNLRQTGANAPVLLPPADGPFAVVTLVTPGYVGAVASAKIRVPSGAEFTLEQESADSNFEIFEPFGSKGALDSAAGNGTYTWTIATAVDGVRTPSLTLGPDAYPSVNPRISNHAALQGADPTSPVTLRWDAMAGGTERDFIQVTVEDDNGEVFATGEPREFDALNGTDTSITIPAGWLTPNTTYTVYLIHARVVSENTTNYPGATGLAAYFKETEYQFTTGAAPPPPPAAGRFVLSSATYAQAEDEGAATITIQRLGEAAGTVGVTLTTRAGSATPGQDYVESTNTYTFTDGQQSLNVPVTVLDDLVLETAETVQLTLSAPTGGADIGSLSSAVLTIVDNEIATRGVLQFAAAAVAVDEAAGQVTLTVTRTGGSQGEVSVVVTSEDGSATSPEDYATVDATLVFSNGVTSRTLIIPIPNDSLDESNETFTVTLSEPTPGAALGANHTATVTLRDNDAAGTISFSAAAYAVGETGGVLNVIVRRVGGGASDVTVDFATENITALSPNDYAGTNFTIVFGSNEVSRTIPIALAQDRLPEGDETFRATLRNPSAGARIGPITNSTITIRDDEVTLQFSSLAYSNRENSAVATVFVERTGPVNVPASVTVATIAGDSATPGADFAPTNFTLNFPPNSRRLPVSIRLLNDQIVEGNETLALELSNPSENALLGPRSQATLTLIDDDAGGKIQFALTNLTVPESRPTALVIVTRTLGLASNVTTRLQTMDLSASDGLDYLGTNVVLEWRGNEVRKLINLPLRPDAIVEGTEQFKIALSDPTGGATLDTKSQMTVNIADDDLGGVIGFARAEFLVNENGTNAAILVTRTGGAASNVTVRFTALEGTAAAPADFAEQNLVVTFAAGETAKTLLVPIVNDTTAEGTPETVVLALREFSGGARPGPITNATLRIVDDESSVAFSAATAMATEGRPITLSVTRSGALGTQVSVDFMTVEGTAAAGANFVATNGTLVFPPNISTRTFSINLPANPATDLGKSFTVALTNPQNGVQIGTPATITLSMKDAPDPNAVLLDGGAAYFRVTATGINGLSLNRTLNLAWGTRQNVSGTTVTTTVLTNVTGPTNFVLLKAVNTKATVNVSTRSSRITSDDCTFNVFQINGVGVRPKVGSGTVSWLFSDVTANSSGGSTIHASFLFDWESGNVIIDDIEYDNNAAIVAYSGRLDIVAKNSTSSSSTERVRIVGSFRVKP